MPIGIYHVLIMNADYVEEEYSTWDTISSKDSTMKYWENTLVHLSFHSYWTEFLICAVPCTSESSEINFSCLYVISYHFCWLNIIIQCVVCMYTDFGKFCQQHIGNSEILFKLVLRNYWCFHEIFFFATFHQLWTPKCY